mgnify:CR=1 FL=1
MEWSGVEFCLSRVQCDGVRSGRNGHTALGRGCTMTAAAAAAAAAAVAPVALDERPDWRGAELASRRPPRTRESLLGARSRLRWPLGSAAASAAVSARSSTLLRKSTDLDCVCVCVFLRQPSRVAAACWPGGQLASKAAEQAAAAAAAAASSLRRPFFAPLSSARPIEVERTGRGLALTLAPAQRGQLGSARLRWSLPLPICWLRSACTPASALSACGTAERRALNAEWPLSGGRAGGRVALGAAPCAKRRWRRPEAKATTAPNRNANGRRNWDTDKHLLRPLKFGLEPRRRLANGSSQAREGGELVRRPRASWPAKWDAEAS